MSVFLPTSRFFNPRLPFSALILSLISCFLYPRFRAFYLSDSCQRYRAFHSAHTQIIHKLSASCFAYFCIFCTFTHLFSPTIHPIFSFFRFLLSRFSTIQCLRSDVRCFARFSFRPLCSPGRGDSGQPRSLFLRCPLQFPTRQKRCPPRIEKNIFHDSLFFSSAGFSSA